MISRRLALAVGLLLAIVASQLPEFVQQYRQRLGGAIDELSSIVARFDQDSASLSLNRDQGIARLQGNTDSLARGRGDSMADVVARKERLDRQRSSFAASGPVSQYVVLLEDLDASIAGQTLSDFQPAIPATTAGFVSAGVGFLVGWLLMLTLTMPTRRTSAPPVHATTWR